MTEPRTRLIRASSDLLTAFGTRTDDGRRITAKWGEPIGHCPDSGEPIYEPTFTATDDGYPDRLRAEARAALLDELEAAVRGLERYEALSPLVYAVRPNGSSVEYAAVLSLIQQHRETT